MDKNGIKKYAVWARRELISRVTQKALQYGIAEKEMQPADASSVNGVVLSAKEKKQRQALIAKIGAKGFEQVMEEAAYTWFNRFTALRFMEVNGYLSTHVRVFTDEENNFKPQILAEAINLEIEGLNMEKVYALKDTNDNDALFKYLIITQCNALSAILPGMFQKIDDYTELLFPDNLLREGSAIEQMIAMIPEEDWQDAVQIIGWLYQYYNTEPKDKVFADLKKNIKITKDTIPAATQLFTPDWIVRYMVENSLGRLWLEGHPNDELKSDWKYYLEEAQQEPQVEEQLVKMRDEYKNIKPENIRCIDPCMGSGHILAYLFDVLVQIYESYGVSTRDAVASIVENNLYGLDIDERAAQLAYFAVMMKARQHDRRFFSRGIQPKIYAICESNSISEYCVDYFCNGDKNLKFAINTIMNEMRDAKEYGSIISVSPQDFAALYARFDEIVGEASMFREETIKSLLLLVQVAETLANKYDCVVTNPPYMGGSGMGARLSEYVKKNYADSKSDLFAVFIERGNNFAKNNGFNCMVTMQSWMFLSSFEKMREKILNTKTLTNLMHMENMVMGIAFGTAVAVIRNNNLQSYKGTYNQIKLCDIENDIPKTFPVSENRFAQVSAENFSKIPGSPVAYWVSERIPNIYSVNKVLGDIADVRHGLSTGKNEMFVRGWYEVSWGKVDTDIINREQLVKSHAKFFPYNKGGEYRKWYGNAEYVLWYDVDGQCKMASLSGHRHDGKLRYFQEGITWSFISSSNFGVRYTPTGFAFDVAGSSMFLDHGMVKYATGILCSCLGTYFMSIQNPTLNYQVGNLKNIPVIIENVELVDGLVDKCIQISKIDWDSFETSWDFERHPLV